MRQTWRSGMRCVEASVSCPLRGRRSPFGSPWSVSVNHCCARACGYRCQALHLIQLEGCMTVQLAGVMQVQLDNC